MKTLVKKSNRLLKNLRKKNNCHCFRSDLLSFSLPVTRNSAICRSKVINSQPCLTDELTRMTEQRSTDRAWKTCLIDFLITDISKCHKMRYDATVWRI